MTVLSEIADAMNRYPQDETTIEIINVAKVGDPGDTDVNEREVWEFHVKLTNNGHVDMTNVSLHILGLNGAKVRETPADTFEEGMIVGDLNPVGGGGVSTSRAFQFKAPAEEKPAGTQLLHAHVQAWNCEGGFDHFFSNHTKDDNEAQELGIYLPEGIPHGSGPPRLNADFRSRDGRKERIGARHAAIPRARTLAGPKARPGCTRKLQPTYATHPLTLRSQRS